VEDPVSRSRDLPPAGFAHVAGGLFAVWYPEAVETWKPHKGPQEAFLACGAFEALYGGAAGGGKSEALMACPTRWVHFPQFRGVLLRRTIPELRRHLLVKTRKFYAPLGGELVGREWRFPSGAIIELASMERAADRFKFDSPEYQFVGFDELTSFEAIQYTHMITRMRTTDDRIPIRLRAASNPGGPGHDWVLRRFAPWLYTDPDEDPSGQSYTDEYDGPYAQPRERAAFLRGEGDDHERMVPTGTPGSTTRAFFPATIDDNPSLDAGYVDRLKQVDLLTYQQKRHGNWMAKSAPGMFFRRDMFTGCYLDDSPKDIIARLRYWDRAATEKLTKAEQSDAQLVADKGPDWTVGLRMSLRRDLTMVVEDVQRLRANPGAVEAFIVATAELDAAEFGPGEVLQVLEQDPGSAGVYEIRALVKALRGHPVKAQRPTGDKVTRAKPVAGQARVGNIYLVRAPWNGVFIAEAESFPMGKKDQIDCLSGASTLLMEVGKPKIQNQRRKLRSMRKAAMGGY